MHYFALIYHVVNDFVQKRNAFRHDHLELAAASHERGELLYGGALGQPVDRALLIFFAASRDVVEEFALNDPYVINGLVIRWEVQPWHVVVGPQTKVK